MIARWLAVFGLALGVTFEGAGGEEFNLEETDALCAICHGDAGCPRIVKSRLSGARHGITFMFNFATTKPGAVPMRSCRALPPVLRRTT